jgi:hypothetical protein
MAEWPFVNIFLIFVIFLIFLIYSHAQGFPGAAGRVPGLPGAPELINGWGRLPHLPLLPRNDTDGSVPSLDIYFFFLYNQNYNAAGFAAPQTFPRGKRRQAPWETCIRVWCWEDS